MWAQYRLNMDYVSGVLITNRPTGSLIWAEMLIHALYICRQIINISLVAWPAHVALQLWTAVPFIIIMLRWSTGGQDGSGKSWCQASFRDKNTVISAWVCFVISRRQDWSYRTLSSAKASCTACMFVLLSQSQLLLLGFTVNDSAKWDLLKSIPLVH